MFTRRSASLVCLFALIGFLTGCSDDETTCPPCGEFLGRIEGDVLAAGRPVGGTISAILPGSARDRSIEPVEEAVIDSAGRYILDVPPGAYLIRAELEQETPPFASDGTLGGRHADTIVVSEGSAPIRVDIRLGSVRVKASTPPEWEGMNVRAYIGTSYPYFLGGGYVGSAFATGGAVDIPLPLVVPDDYRTYLMNSRGDGVYLPVTYAIDEADWFTVGLDEETIYECPTPVPSPGFLKGRVTGSWQVLGEFPPGVTIHPEGFLMGKHQKCEPDGSFEERLYGVVRARLEISVGRNSRWLGGASFDEATVYELEPGKIVDIEIATSGIGGALGPGGGRVHIYNDAGVELDDASLASTTGRFKFPDLLPGTYFLEFKDGTRWIDHWYDGAESRETATPIVISSEGQTIWLDPQVLEGGSIRGRVLDSSGQPIHVASLRAVSAADSVGGFRWTGMGDAAGEFWVRALPDGPYTLAVETASYGRVWYPGVYDWNGAEPIQIENYEEVSGIVIQYP